MCHVSPVNFHVVTCHVSHVIKKKISFKKIGQGYGASRWRVCYRRGLLRLVYSISDWIILFLLCWNIFRTPSLPNRKSLGSWNFERWVSFPNLSCITCHMSQVTCHVSQLIFFIGQSGEASTWRVCYQQVTPSSCCGPRAVGMLLPLRFCCGLSVWCGPSYGGILGPWCFCCGPGCPQLCRAWL